MSPSIFHQTATLGAVQICNLNFHTTMGGTQYTLATILPILAKHYSLYIVDPYKNIEFATLIEECGLSVETVVDLSRQTRISVHSGFRRWLDFMIVAPRYFMAVIKLHQFLIERNVSLVYVNQTKAALIAWLATLGRLPVIYHCHDPETPGISLIIRISPCLSHIIANSHYTGRKLIALGVKPCHISIVENTISVRDTQLRAAREPRDKLPAINSHPILLLPQTGIEPNKGALLLIEAFGQLVGKGLPGELWITGDLTPAYIDYGKKVRQRIFDLGLNERIHLLGRRSDILPIMAIADIIVIPTIYKESFGRAAAEAMILGKPLVVSNRGALPDLVQDYETGFVFDPDQQDDLTIRLADLIANKYLREDYGAAAARYAAKRFDLVSYESKLLRIFENTIKPSSSHNRSASLVK